ncbi:porin [Candidatus Pelagibacter sp.]|nr:porin [Candidatus Pelagibacter sp.]
MNNFKKIGLTALAASLVSVSANAGEMSVSGSASIGTAGYSGTAVNSANEWSMGNQLTFSGSGELDNGLTVSMSFVLDQGDDKGTDTNADDNAGAPFDSHSVTISSDALGTLVFSGEGGSSTASAIDTTAAGDLWDAFDGMTNADGQTDGAGVASATAGVGNNAFFYTSPDLMEGLNLTASWGPSAAATESKTGYGVNYTGVEGLTVKYAVADVVKSNTTTENGDSTVLSLSYAYGPVTVAYSDMAYDIGTASSDVDTTAMKVSYTVTDELSVSYAQETIDRDGTTTDAEYEGITAAYTTGGMTISAGMYESDSASFTTATNEDYEKWTLGASFAF